jgi:hypothetical protein
MDMEFHVRKLLSSLELTRIMTFDECHNESKRRRKSTAIEADGRQRRAHEAPAREVAGVLTHAIEALFA